MIALDTNILARFYVDDPEDPEAAKQRPIARRIITESPSLLVPITVVLELEWVLRAFYGFDAEQVVRVFEHLIGLWSQGATASATTRSFRVFPSRLPATACSMSATTACTAAWRVDASPRTRATSRISPRPMVSIVRAGR